MKTILAGSLAFCLILLGVAELASGADCKGTQALYTQRPGMCLLFPRSGIVASVFRRIGRSVADKIKEEQRTTSPVRTQSRPAARSVTPVPRSSATRSAPSVRRTQSPTVNRPSVRQIPRSTRSILRPSSRTLAPVRKINTRPTTTLRPTTSNRVVQPSGRTSIMRTIGRSVSESVRSRAESSRQRSTFTRTPTRATTTPSRRQTPRPLPGIVGRETLNVGTRSGASSSTVRGHAGRPYVTSRYSRGASGGTYVTSRFSRGHAGTYVTSRYSRGHATSYVTARYSRGHYIPSTASQWYNRARGLRRYTHHYRYYGRDSDYYFSHGAWLPIPPGHIHGPGCGHVFRYGRWVAAQAVFYPVFVPAYANYYYDGGWHAEAPIYVGEEEGIVVPSGAEPALAEPAPEYVSVRTKAERELEVITRVYELDWWEAKRVEELISAQIIESILAGGEAGEQSRIVFDKGKQRLTITGSPDDIMRIRTMIDDDRTYKLLTQEDLGGLVADAVPLVDLRFVENDPSGALRIAADNYSGADEILRSSEVSPFGREWWFNDELGTMTVKDSVKNLDAVYEFVETRPYLR